MNNIQKSALAALAFGILGAAPAAADYSIVVDKGFPSVVYVEFDRSTTPVIYTAPGSDPALPVIRGGTVDNEPTSATNPSNPDAAQSDDDQQSDGTSASSDDSNLSIDERAQKKVDELVQGGPDAIENTIIDRKIEDQLLEDLDIDING